jgi:hypothetical protein
MHKRRDVMLQLHDVILITAVGWFPSERYDRNSILQSKSVQESLLFILLAVETLLSDRKGNKN